MDKMCIFWLFILLGSVSNVFGENGLDDEVYEKTAENSRQKRLLFYDEEGNLVKMFINPYLRDTPFSSDKVIGTFLNPFFSLFRPPAFAFPPHYMVPVSSEVIHQISTDPVFQNKLMILPPQPLDMKADPLCNNRRNQVPSPQICNNFLNCWDGWAFEQECPAGLLFSNLGYCDYPHNVNCFDRRVIDATQSQPQSSQLQPQQPKPQPQPQPQPQPHHPSQLPPLSQPEPQLPPLSQPQPQFPAQFQPQSQCSQEFEVFRNKVDCREFFVCVNQLPVKFKCPADLAYNQELGICDYPERVDCNGSFDSSTSAPTPEASSLTSEKDAEASAPTESLVPAGSKPPIGVQTTLTKSSYNSESWSTSHIAMSRQDAIRQLELRRFANVHSSF